MAQNSYDAHHIISISEAVDNALTYMEGRRTGEIKSLATRWKKFNRNSMGGIEPNALYTFAGISGSGKSSLVNMIETDIIDLNPQEDIVVLSLTFEMLSSKQVTRKISSIVKRSMKRLYSVDEALTDDEMKFIRNASTRLRNYPIYYVDVAQNCEDIENTIRHFQERFPEKTLVVFLDHTLLVEGLSNQSEQALIADLQKRFIKLKKIGKTSIIQVSQLNRDIESAERVGNMTRQYPMRSDISSSDKIFHASDYVYVIHRPEMLNIASYGPDSLPTENIIFLHTIKNREGNVGIIRFENHLAHNNLIELE